MYRRRFLNLVFATVVGSVAFAFGWILKRTRNDDLGREVDGVVDHFIDVISPTYLVRFEC